MEKLQNVRNSEGKKKKRRYWAPPIRGAGGREGILNSSAQWSSPCQNHRIVRQKMAVDGALLYSIGSWSTAQTQELRKSMSLSDARV